MTEQRSTVVENRYFDSVFLMRVAKRISGEPGIAEAAAVMATPKNVQLLADAGYDGVGELTATSNDLIVSVKAEDGEFAAEVIDDIGRFLERENTSSGGVSVRSIKQAAESKPAANLAVISVPGEFAAHEAKEALNAGLNVFLFSDNVSLEDEIELKQLGRDKGLLVMGPDCGTSIIGGAGIGFANVVKRGPIGVIGASGTGIQEVTTLISKAGSGISHAIGVGSHDLSDAIGGVTSLQALELLAKDAGTEIVVFISKPPGEATQKRLVEALNSVGKPVVTCFLGAPADPANERMTTNLDDAVSAALALVGAAALRSQTADPAAFAAEMTGKSAEQKYVRGIFAGGTFTYQAQQVMLAHGLSIHSNAPLTGAQVLADSAKSVGHALVDMGADEFTQGYPHPMVDSSQRSKRILEEASDPSVAVLLIDAILGYSAADDPVGDLVPAMLEAKKIAEVRGDTLSIVASVCGTAEDPQGLQSQIDQFEVVGARVFPSARQAADFAASLAKGSKR